MIRDSSGMFSPFAAGNHEPSNSSCRIRTMAANAEPAAGEIPLLDPFVACDCVSPLSWSVSFAVSAHARCAPVSKQDHD
jgi:hypothetical protein